MTRYLGIDYGINKTGLSLSDPLKIIAKDYTVLFKLSDEQKVQEIAKIIKLENIELIVVGLPKNMDGTEGFQVKEVRDFCERLVRFEIDIKFIDERLTTKMAETLMKNANVKKSEIKLKSDARAASLILQEYLDYT